MPGWRRTVSTAALVLAAEPAPAPTAVAPSAPAPAHLPRTGWDAALPGVLGVLFLTAGVALRAHVRRAP